MIWKPFYVVCSACGHKNRPHKSPREGVRMALAGELPPCKGCGGTLRPRLADRPLVQQVRQELTTRHHDRVLAKPRAILPQNGSGVKKPELPPKPFKKFEHFGGRVTEIFNQK